MRRIDKLLGGEQRGTFGNLSWPDYLDYWSRIGFNGIEYVVPHGNVAQVTALQGERNAIVAACMSVRAAVFSEIRFAWQRYVDGRPSELFGTQSLGLIERPWPGATTRDLLATMEVDASLYGNSYWIVVDGQMVRLDPSRVKVITGEIMVAGEPVARRLLAYAVVDDAGSNVVTYLPDQIVHYAPLPSASEPFTGISWLGTVLPDVTADHELTRFKTSFVGNSAVPGLAITYPPDVTIEQVRQVKETIEAKHSGAGQAFKTLHLGGGADAKVVGANLEQVGMKAVQGAGETRIAAAAGVPAVIVGISEGMQGSALNSGNYNATRRRFADGTIRPLWRAACGALQQILEMPQPSDGVRLWYDDRDVPFLQEDVLDSAEIRSKDAATLRQLWDGGADPDSAIDAVITGDFSRIQHSGKLSVQLQPPDQDMGEDGDDTAD